MAQWTQAYVNDLPDSAFLYIAPGGKKDDTGRTVPRGLRYFPYRDQAGAVDLPHLRNAIARIPQSSAPGLSADRKRSLQEKAQRILERANQSAAAAPPDLVTITVPLSIQAADAGKEGEKKGPPTFSMVAYTGGPMEVRGFWSPVVLDLAGGRGLGSNKPILRDHDPAAIVGHGRARRDGARLIVEGVISGTGPAAAEVVSSSANGFPWQASIGARVEKSVELAEGKAAAVNGQAITGPATIARKWSLKELSFVALGADENTSVKIAASAASSQQGDDAMGYEQWLEALGLADADLSEVQQARLRAKYDAEAKAAELAAAGGEADPPGVTALEFDRDEIRAIAAEALDTIEGHLAEHEDAIESKALLEIKTKHRRAIRDLKAKALKEKWLGPRAEIEMLKAAHECKCDLICAQRPKAPAIHGSPRDLSDQVIQAAFCRSAGLRGLDKQFKPEVLEASDHLPGFGLQEVLLHYAVQGGYSGRMRIGDGNIREVLKAAFSTNTVTTLLTQAGNKILLEGFNALPQTWREVAQVRSVVDFKQVTAFRMTASLEYEEVGPAGEIKHGTAGQESYTVQARTYARMLALTRQDIINDDLGAFNDLRNRLGIGAAIKLNKVLWTAWLAAYAGGAFWTAARGNLVTGSALGDTGITNAVKAFRNMAAPDGNMMNLEPDRILVPSDLEATARKWYASQEVRDTTASTRAPTTNIWFNRFRPIVVPELGNSSYTGYSATTWYMLANPAVLASALVCFLNGQEAPTIESAESDFNTLGIQFRGYHDFGVSMSEYRASVAAAA